MRHLMRAVVAVVAVAAPVEAATVLPTATAGASGSQLSCLAAKGTYTGSIEFKHCTPPGGAHKDATITTDALLSGRGTLVWQKSDQTTTLQTTATLSPTSPACKQPKGKAHTPVDQEIDVTGVATGGSSQYTLPGDTISITLCETLKTGKLLLAKGTAARF